MAEECSLGAISFNPSVWPWAGWIDESNEQKRDERFLRSAGRDHLDEAGSSSITDDWRFGLIAVAHESEQLTAQFGVRRLRAAGRRVTFSAASLFLGVAQGISDSSDEHGTKEGAGNSAGDILSADRRPQPVQCEQKVAFHACF